MEQWAMLCGRFAVCPSRRPVLLDAIQPGLRLTVAGVSATCQPAVRQVQSHTLPHAPGNTRENVEYDARPEPRQTFE